MIRIKTVFGGTVSVSPNELDKLKKGAWSCRTVSGTRYHRENLILTGIQATYQDCLI